MAIQGFVGFAEQMIGSRRCKIAIVSRLSSKRAGTRFNARGLNDEGHVSNFVETEFLYMCSSQVFSFLQVRGSVPLFWEQSGIQMTSHKIEISRGPETTEPAMRKHMEVNAFSISLCQVKLSHDLFIS